MSATKPGRSDKINPAKSQERKPDTSINLDKLTSNSNSKVYLSFKSTERAK